LSVEDATIITYHECTYSFLNPLERHPPTPGGAKIGARQSGSNVSHGPLLTLK